jgi:hypothetical protein
MNQEIINAYLWQNIIRLGFSPQDDKTKNTWLYLYNRSLKSFWELDDYPENPSKARSKLYCTINCQTSLDITFEYTIEELNKFTVRIMSPIDNLMWIHDYDNSFFTFPQNELLNFTNKNKKAIKLISRPALQSVIESLMTHPTPHQHIESPIDNHNIRIGGGIINPYLYLFHLRFQFCPDQSRQEMELSRLITLFEKAIYENTVIPPSELMKLPT